MISKAILVFPVVYLLSDFSCELTILSSASHKVAYWKSWGVRVLQLNQLGELNDVQCNAEFSFICKKTPLSLKQYCSSFAAHKAISDGQRYLESFRKDYNYIEAVESFYKLHTTSKNWRDAKSVCTQEGASLFYPEHSDEAKAVISFWKLYQNNTQPDDTWVYVGITDIVTEGEFETIDNKSISEVYHHWKLSQPDNSGDEDCLHLNQLGELNDIKCNAEYSFICKKTPRPLGWPCICDIQKSNLNGQRKKKFFRYDYTFIEASQGFYKMHTTPKTFADAKRVCALEGAGLYYPDNEDEAHAVGAFWNETQPTIPVVYAGISALIAKGVFETIDNKPLSEVYNKWKPGEPNDYLDIEDCVSITKEGLYTDCACDRMHQFICKKSLQSLEWDYSCDMPDLDYTYNDDIGKCYKFHTTPLKWTDAYAVCSAEQSYLAVITNRMEAVYLAKLTESAPEQRVKGDYLRGIYHVGFLNRFNEGWRTVKGTTLNATETWWGNHEPVADDNEQCGSMFFNGLLTYVNCDMRSFFICEHEVTQCELNSSLHR